jgi:hypothetical protein
MKTILESILIVFYILFMPLLHEAGHLITAYFIGGNGKIVIVRKVPPLYYSKIKFDIDISDMKNLVLTSAGFMFQFLFNFAFLLQNIFPNLKLFSFLYLGVIALNVIPVKPSDGYYIFQIFQQIRSKWNRKMMNKLFRFAQWTIFYILFTSGIISEILIVQNAIDHKAIFNLSLGVISTTVIIRIIEKLIRIYKKGLFYGDH